MTIALVQTSKAQGSTVSFTNPTQAGNCVIACVGSYDSVTAQSIAGITLGGSAARWAPLATAAQVNGIKAFASIWANPGCEGGQTAVAVTGTGLAGSGNGTIIYEFSGLPAVAASRLLDQASVAVAATGLSWSSGGTAATSQADELWIGCADSFSAASGPASPWTNSALTYAIAGYQIVSAAGPAVYAGTQPSSNYWAAAVVTLRSAARAAPGSGASIVPSLVAAGVLA